jgi:hypothetical protein
MDKSKETIFKLLNTAGEPLIAGGLGYAYKKIFVGTGNVEILGFKIDSGLLYGGLIAMATSATSAVNNWIVPLFDKSVETEKMVKSYAPAITIGTNFALMGAIDWSNGNGFLSNVLVKESLMAGGCHMVSRYANDAALGALAKFKL